MAMSEMAPRNFYEFFQMPEMFRLDLSVLDSHYLELQARVHPDKAAHLSDAEKRLSLQWATFANEAYQTLKRPLDRARYLLRIHGVDTREEDNTAMPAEFLLEQIEWREEMQDAIAGRSEAALDRLGFRLKKEMDHLIESLGAMLDIKQSHPDAAVLVRQLAFLEKLKRDLDQAHALLED
ncbi:Fe-S protein assembly co-chaperone HscB [Methylococcus mesophilus]|nr:Fe-S protein assembly co-chaperone HscB [Methylococcus mesophilus]